MQNKTVRVTMVVLMVLNGLLFVSNIYVLGNAKAAIEMHTDLSPMAGPTMANGKVIVCFVAGILYLIAAYAVFARKRHRAVAGVIGFVIFDGFYLVELVMWGGSHLPVWLGFCIFGGLGLLIGWYSWLTSRPFEFADYPRVLNIHERMLDIPADRAGELIDSLASASDLLWPADRWPAMQFDRPLGVGAVGGHGPIRYCVDSYASGRNIQFRFVEPRGFVGIHRFEIESTGNGRTTLRHVIDMRAVGLAWLAWTVAIRPLHNALLEDALDRAEIFGGKQLPKREWSVWVRFVRWIMQRRTKKR
jgi:hypothetical protein